MNYKRVGREVFGVLVGLVTAALLHRIAFAATPAANVETNEMRIGWIGAMTGSTARYGAHEAAQIAVDDANETHRADGFVFQLDAEDGKCQSKEALNAMMRLTDIAGVKFIVGGHCSNESLAIAPVAERERVLMMAAITSSPKLSGFGEMVFRVTAPNTKGAELVVDEAVKRGLKSIVTVYEETEYAEGLGLYVDRRARERGLQVLGLMGVIPGTNDFKSVVSRIRSARPQAVYFSPQSPELTLAFFRALREQSVDVVVFGNEIAGNAGTAFLESGNIFEGMIFPEPEFDSSTEGYRTFADKFSSRFGHPPPLGFWTAEAYDAVRVVLAAIVHCGREPDKVAACLAKGPVYQGLSGPIGFDSNGDGVRVYALKEIRNGVGVTLK